MASKVSDNDEKLNEGTQEQIQDESASELDGLKRQEENISTSEEGLEGNEESTCIVIAASTLQNHPKVFEMIEKSKKIKKVFVTDGPIKYEQQQVCKSIGEELGKELSSTSGAVAQTLRQREQLASQLAENLCRFATTIGDDFITAEGMPDTQPLTQEFDNAVSSLFSVPIAKQDPQQLFMTFLNLSLFSIRVIDLCNQLGKASDKQIVLHVMIVGTQMHRVANEHGLYKWLNNNGGWSGLYAKICDYIAQLRNSNTSTESTDTDSIWPSWNAIILFGSVTTFALLYSYFKYKW